MRRLLLVLNYEFPPLGGAFRMSSVISFVEQIDVSACTRETKRSFSDFVNK